VVDDHDRFDIVVVCNGNRFRSPLVEGVLRRATEGLPVRVRSVGTMDLPPGPALPEAIEFGRSVGLDLAPHRSRRLSDDDLSGADLVLGFELSHVARAVVDAQARRERTFLVSELADVLVDIHPPQGPDVPARARRTVSLADEARRKTDSRRPPEIGDPFGGSAVGYRRTGEQVREAAERIAGALFGRPTAE
jgi:protein-tyrosine phosphatase